MTAEHIKMTEEGKAMKISVIIPMYNEEKIIAETARTLSDYMSALFEPNEYEIIFSDDGSADASRAIVDNCGLPCVRTVGYEKNCGKGRAVRNGMLAAAGEVRIFTDADLAYGVGVIGEAYDAMCRNSDADMLIGSRNLRSDGYAEYTRLRRLMSKVYIKVLCAVGGFKLSDSQCGFKAFRAETAEAVFGECTVDGFAFDFEAILRAQKRGLKITEMPVKIINHRASAIRPVRDALKMLRDLRKIKKDIS